MATNDKKVRDTMIRPGDPVIPPGTKERRYAARPIPSDKLGYGIKPPSPYPKPKPSIPATNLGPAKPGPGDVSILPVERPTSTTTIADRAKLASKNTVLSAISRPTVKKPGRMGYGGGAAMSDLATAAAKKLKMRKKG